MKIWLEVGRRQKHYSSILKLFSLHNNNYGYALTELRIMEKIISNNHNKL